MTVAGRGVGKRRKVSPVSDVRNCAGSCRRSWRFSVGNFGPLRKVTAGAVTPPTPPCEHKLLQHVNTPCWARAALNHRV